MTDETTQVEPKPMAAADVVKTGERREQVIWGALLMGGGVLFLASQLDLVDLPPIWNWWPAIFFAIGLPKLFSAREWPSGISMFLIGLTFFAIMERWWGLGWSTGWPLFLVITGLEIVIKAFFVERREESGNA